MFKKIAEFFGFTFKVKVVEGKTYTLDESGKLMVVLK